MTTIIVIHDSSNSLLLDNINIPLVIIIISRIIMDRQHHLDRYAWQIIVEQLPVLAHCHAIIHTIIIPKEEEEGDSTAIIETFLPTIMTMTYHYSKMKIF